jgi:S-adenosylmethionine decarboxylase
MNTSTEFTQFGVHLMVDGYGADPKRLSDESFLRTILEDLPKTMGMHTICDPVVVEVGPKNRKDPGGISGFVMIAESHISFHTFPARGFITLDVYTCQNDLDTEKMVSEFATSFEWQDCDIFIQKRGTKYPVENIL